MERALGVSGGLSLTYGAFELYQKAFDITFPLLAFEPGSPEMPAYVAGSFIRYFALVLMAAGMFLAVRSATSSDHHRLL